MNAALHNIFSDVEMRGKFRFYAGFEKIIDILRLPRRRDIWRDGDIAEPCYKAPFSLRVWLLNLQEYRRKSHRAAKTEFPSRFLITKVFTVILLYSNALCQLFLFAVIQEELVNV